MAFRNTYSTGNDAYRDSQDLSGNSKYVQSKMFCRFFFRRKLFRRTKIRKKKSTANVFPENNFAINFNRFFRDLARFSMSYGQTDLKVRFYVKFCFRYTMSHLCMTIEAPYNFRKRPEDVIAIYRGAIFEDVEICASTIILDVKVRVIVQRQSNGASCNPPKLSPEHPETPKMHHKSQDEHQET